MKLGKKTKISLVVLTILLGWILWLEFQSYQYPSKKELQKRINYLERVTNSPLTENFDIVQLSNINHEFMLFTYAYTTYALTNIVRRDSTYKKQAVSIMQTSIRRALSSRITSSYMIDYDVEQVDSLPKGLSVLYFGHLNLMLGCYRLISADSSYNSLHNKISYALVRAYQSKHFLNLESYPNGVWTADNTVGIASIKLWSYLAKNNYDTVCKQWVNYAKKHLLEKETKLLYSTVHHQTGMPMEEPRGSMIGWSIMFIYQFDSPFAIELYKHYKENFSSNYPVFRLFRERANNYQSDDGDIDSGPIVWGFSIPANEFALGDAILANDLKTAGKMKRLIDFGSEEIDKNNEIRHQVKFVDLKVSPMAEALILHSLTITKWIDE